MYDPKDLASQLGFELSSLQLTDEELKKPREIDRRICLCGHPVSRHSLDGGVICVPARWQCHCKNLKPVMVVDDTRLFAKRSYGYGEEHALMRTLPDMVRRHRKGEWLPNLNCSVQNCDYQDHLLTPAMLEEDVQSGRYIVLRNERNRRPSIYMRKIIDVLLCPAHLQQLLEVR